MSKMTMLRYSSLNDFHMMDAQFNDNAIDEGSNTKDLVGRIKTL